MQKSIIKHQSMRSAVRSALRDEIAQGGLRPGEKLEEEKLSALLGVSRTPIREALFGLEREGLVDFVPNKGCHVAVVNAQKVRELYPMIGALEALSIRTTRGFSDETLATLASLTESMTDSDPKVRGEADRKWHEVLIENSDNEVLIETTKNLRLRAMQFDDFSGRGVAEPRQAVQDHRDIVQLLVEKEYDKAADLSEKHWQWGIGVVSEWLAQKELNDV